MPTQTDSSPFTLRPNIAELLEAWDDDTRPENYGDFEDPIRAILNGIKGQMRRDMVRDMLAAEGDRRELLDELLGAIEPDLMEESVDESFTRLLSNMAGPQWMGGEYLPTLADCEVEIARIILNSTLMDITSLRARFDGERYHYSMVDDNGGRYLVYPLSSSRPLSTKEVITILEASDYTHFGGEEMEGWGPGTEYHQLGRVEAYWHQQYSYGYPAQECLDFVRVESEFYPGVEEWFDWREQVWRDERTTDSGETIPFVSREVPQ